MTPKWPTEMRRTALLLVALLLSCDSSGGPFIIQDPGAGGGPTQLRLLHASQNSGNLQLLTGGQTQLGAIGFTSVTPYTDLTATSLSLTLRTSPGGIPILDTVVTIPDSSLVTVVADGDSANLTLRLVFDGRPVADTTFIKLRMLHESPASAALDLYVTDPLVLIDTVPPTLAGVTYRVATQYLILQSGTYQIRVTTGGTKDIVVDTGILDLGNGAVRTLTVFDATGGGLPAQSRVLDDGET